MSIVLFGPDPCCSLCDVQFQDGEAILSLTYMGIGLKPYDEQFRSIDDGVVHQACMDQWDRRDAFVAAYNEAAEGCGCGGLGLAQGPDGVWTHRRALETRRWIRVTAVVGLLVLAWWAL